MSILSNIVLTCSKYILYYPWLYPAGNKNTKDTDKNALIMATGIGNTCIISIWIRYSGIGGDCIRDIYTKDIFVWGVKPRTLVALGIIEYVKNIKQI